MLFRRGESVSAHDLLGSLSRLIDQISYLVSYICYTIQRAAVLRARFERKRETDESVTDNASVLRVRYVQMRRRSRQRDLLSFLPHLFTA